jgi:hypothetical protein
MIMKTRIKIAHFLHQKNSGFIDRVRKSFASYVLRCRSVFNHNFAMRFFNYKKLFNLGKQKIKHFSTSLPIKNRSSKSFFASPTITRIFRTAKSIFKPQNKTFITACNFKQRMPLIAGTIFTLFGVTNVEASFSIDNASKISNLRFDNICLEDNFSSHAFILHISVLNEKTIHGERLNEKTPLQRRCDSLNSRGNLERECRRASPPIKIGHKSNRKVLNEAAKRLGVALRQTEDELVRDMLAATASFINCTNGHNSDNPTEITREDVDTVIRTLAGNNAYTISDNIEGEDKFGTSPVRDAYFALTSTSLIGDLENVSGFIAKAQYPSPMNALRPEWGSVSNLRFLLSSIGSVTQNASLLGADIYNIFCVGMEAYACIEQDGYSAQFIYRPPIYDSPLALNASVGWKMAQVPRITNDAWVFNLRATLA